MQKNFYYNYKEINKLPSPNILSMSAILRDTDCVGPQDERRGDETLFKLIGLENFLSKVRVGLINMGLLGLWQYQLLVGPKSIVEMRVGFLTDQFNKPIALTSLTPQHFVYYFLSIFSTAILFYFCKLFR